MGLGAEITRLAKRVQASFGIPQRKRNRADSEKKQDDNPQTDKGDSGCAERFQIKWTLRLPPAYRASMKTADKIGRIRIAEILANGISRRVDSEYKSSNISSLDKNKDSENIAYRLDIAKDKSVSVGHENEKHR